MAKDKRFSQQIDLKSFLLDSEKQRLYYWNRNIGDSTWGEIINQTDNLRGSNPKSVLLLQEAMALYSSFILGIGIIHYNAMQY